MFDDINQNYVDGVGKNRIQFNRVTNPSLHDAMQPVFNDFRDRCEVRNPYGDVDALWHNGSLVAWLVDPEDNHRFIIFYDVKPMWRLAHQLGHLRALAQYSPRIELDALDQS